MTPIKFKNLILSFTDDILFDYDGEMGFINPWNANKFELSYGEVDKTYDDINALMSDPIYHGASLNEIADKITLRL